MHRKLSTCINQLNPNATATVSLQGLMISYFKLNGKFMTRVIKCEDHHLRVDIFKVPRVASREQVACLPPPIEVHDSVRTIRIRELETEAGRPSTGVLTYKNFNTPFTRTPATGSRVDFKDFRWIVDLNSDEFHNRQLKFKRRRERIITRKSIAPMISINSGTVYTQAVSSEILFSRDEEGRHKLLGRIAYRTGIDIMSARLSVTVTDDKCHHKYEWTNLDDHFYLIQVSNNCSLKPVDKKMPELTAGKSDFDLFYDLLRDPVIDHRRYDLQACVGDANAPRPQMDGFPEICILGYLGGVY